MFRTKLVLNLVIVEELRLLCLQTVLWKREINVKLIP